MSGPEAQMPVELPSRVLPQLLIVSCTHPAEGAEALATALVEGRLAACVQVSPGLRSIYRWEGKIESAGESRLDIKTTAERLPDVILTIRRLHPYAMPEIVAVPVVGGSDAYLDWVREQTGPI